MVSLDRIVLGWLVASSMSVSAAHAIPGDNVADRVLGQKLFTQGQINFVEGKGMNDPSSVAIDRSATPNHLCVADYDNSRVLCWADAPGFTRARPATLVIGQASFNDAFCNRGQPAAANTLCFPSAVAFDTEGDLYVADNFNNRVLVFDSPFTSGMTANQSAIRVFGQPSFSANSCVGGTATGLCAPTGMAFDAEGNLFVADGLGVFGSNNRVVEFDDPKAPGGGTPGTPGSDGDTTADRVYGQAGFGTGLVRCNRGTGPFSPPPTAETLCGPTDVAIDSAGNLLVADTQNNRVVVYVDPLDDTTTADFVFGQSDDFTTATFGTGPGELRFPTGITTDPAGRVWVGDSLNGRIVVFDAPLTADRIADHILGDGGFFPSRLDIGNAVDVDLDAAGNLYVADGMPPVNLSGGYSRVHRLDAPLTTDERSDGLLGQKGSTGFSPNLVDSIGMAGAPDMAFDRSASPTHVYAVDSGNSRVLAWADATSFDNGAPADLVLGQANTKDNQCNRGGVAPTANTLCHPQGVDVDAFGNVWVADTNNHRILEFDSPFASGLTADQSASRVFGQADFAGAAPNRGAGAPTAASLNQPRSLQLDGAGRLWVADSSNFRILMFNGPLGVDRNADLVLGQPTFTSSTFPSTPGPDVIAFPTDVFIDGQGHVYSSDPSYDRVLIHLNPLAPGGGTPGVPGSAGDRTADRLFGQVSFADFGCNDYVSLARRAESLCGVNDLAVDGAGHLWIVDGGNHRVVRHDAPLTGDQVADAVLGAPDFVTNATTCSSVRTADRFCFPRGIGFDTAGNLWISETGSSRLVVFDAVTSPAPPRPTCNGLVATHVGTDADDEIVGTSGPDVIVGGEGDDTITGGGGADTICGGNGDDTLRGGAGGDDLFGQGDDDKLLGGAGDDTLDGGAGTADVCKGGTGTNSESGCP